MRRTHLAMSRLIVKNLPRELKESRLKEIFEKHGSVSQVKYFSKRHFAYVGFLQDADCAKAVKHLNETYIDTAKIEVSLAFSFGVYLYLF